MLGTRRYRNTLQEQSQGLGGVRPNLWVKTTLVLSHALEQSLHMEYYRTPWFMCQGDHYTDSLNCMCCGQQYNINIKFNAGLHRNSSLDRSQALLGSRAGNEASPTPCTCTRLALGIRGTSPSHMVQYWDSGSESVHKFLPAGLFDL